MMKQLRSLVCVMLIVTLAAPAAFAADEPGRRPGRGGDGTGSPGPGPGPGPGRPGPTPTPAPTPAPTPTPAPAPTPAPVDTSAARAQGLADGKSDGEINGSQDGRTAGHTEGKARGYKDGFDRCERDQIQRAHARGYRDGMERGQFEGRRDGIDRGRSDGNARGQSDGQSDGLSRANNDARNAATGPGRERGYNEANASDAPQAGERDGIVAGDRTAHDQAEAYDYPRGREAYRAERWNKAPGREDSFNQKAPVAQVASLGAISEMFSAVGKDVSDALNGAAARTYPTPEEQAAYNEAYKQGYTQSFGQARKAAYDQAYAQAHRASAEQGCREAERRDYRHAERRGFEEGQREGYRRAYDNAYRRSYDDEYARTFREVSDAAYAGSYDGYYNQHFEAARNFAYSERYNQIYRAAYENAKSQKYNEVYPGYAEAAYTRSRNDEAQDFANRPLRLTSAEATETINNGLYEPGEALRVKFNVRNFNTSKVLGNQVKLTLEALDAKSAVISEGESSLVKAVEADSLTIVKEALEFRMNENADGRVKGFRLSVYVNGKLSDQRDFSLTTNFLAEADLAEMPELKEGIQTSIKVKVTNRSNKATDVGTTVTFRSQPEILEVLNDKATIGVIAAGATKVVEFPVITRGHGSYLHVPYVIDVTTGAGRRVGLESNQRSIPIVNDYRIDITSGAQALRSAGVARIEYRITNVGSRLLMKGLQLHVKVEGDENNFVVIGPNPQYVQPLLNGQSFSFVVPMVVRTAGAKGTLQLEVKEDGNTVVIHRAEF